MENTGVEQELRTTLGLMMFKPDAIDDQIVEELIDISLGKLKKTIPDIELKGVIFIPSVTEEQTEKIYPNLNENYLRGMKTLLKRGPVLVVFWGSDSGTKDLWQALLSLRGKIGKGYGIEDSIRSIIPLPHRRQDYEKLSKRIKEGNLSDEDYVELCKGLIHVPDNINEYAGLLSSLDKNEVTKILGKEDASQIVSKTIRFIK